MKNKFLIILMGVVIFASSAWGGSGINVHCGTETKPNARAQDNTGADLKISSVIQWVLGNPGLPNPNMSGLLNSGTLYNTYNVGLGTNQDKEEGKFDINTSAPSDSYLRVWENGSPATGSYYKTLGPYTSSTTPFPTEVQLDTFKTEYLADVPPPPTVSAGGFKLTWDAQKEDYLVDFSLTAHAASTPKVEVNSWSIQVRKATDDWAAGRSYTAGATWPITEDPANPYFIAGENYVAVAAAGNYFGTSDWGPQLNFTIPTGGDGPAAGPVTYEFLTVEGGLGLNDFSILHNLPFRVDTDPPSSVDTIGELVDAVNLKSGETDTVSAIGWLYGGQMQGFYVTYDAQGNPTYTPTRGATGGAETPLERGKSYQISVVRDVTVTFSQ